VSSSSPEIGERRGLVESRGCDESDRATERRAYELDRLHVAAAKLVGCGGHVVDEVVLTLGRTSRVAVAAEVEEHRLEAAVREPGRVRPPAA
jgi:hypothetical protein